MVDGRDRGRDNVPVSVIDKIIKINQENNDAYNEIVRVLDTLSDNLVDVHDTLDNLRSKIDSEQLGSIMQECTVKIQKDLDELGKVVSTLRESQHYLKESSFIKVFGEYLKFNEIHDNTFAKMVIDHLNAPITHKSNLETLEWSIGIVGGCKRHWSKIMIIFGATLMFIYLAGGKTIMDLISKLK